MNSAANQNASVLPVSCNKDCGAGCPLLAHVQNGRLIKVTNNPLGRPIMTGCTRGLQMPRSVYAADRLRTPLLRRGPRGTEDFVEITWEEALDRVAAGLTEIRDRCGPQGVMRLGGGGSCRGALHNTDTLTRRFLHFFGGYTDISGGYSAQATDFASDYVFGTQRIGLDRATLESSRLIILWGANICDTRFGCETEGWIRHQKKQGQPIVVIDPRRSRTVRRLATEWIQVLPGTDTILMAAVLYVLLTEKLIDRAFVNTHSVGFDTLSDYILGCKDGQPKTPQWASGLCGTSVDGIFRLARLYGGTRPAALIPGLSIQRTLGGEDTTRLAAALQLATGNVGINGGSSGGSIWSRLPGPSCPTIAHPQAKNHPQVPVYRWPDAVLEGTGGGYPTDIEGLYTVGGNYIAQGSDVGKNIRAFRKAAFSVCHDSFLTPTARYSDIVLPTTTFLEREDITFPDGNYLFFSHRVIEPVGQARNDYDIFCALAKRLGFYKTFSEQKTAAQWIESFIDASEIEDKEAFRRTGIYRGRDQRRVGLADFSADPSGHPLPTPSGRIEIASKAYTRTGFPEIPTCTVQSEVYTSAGFPLRLITPHARFRINSQFSNIPWFREREAQEIWIHPGDAGSRGILPGQRVSVSSPEGRTVLPARITEDIMPGVVCILAGAWPRIEGDGSESAGAANMLTSTVPTESSQGSRTHSVVVEVEGL